METEGFYTDIKPFAVHDGPGIRTTLFLKGCPLRCVWCHNPETIHRKPELELTVSRCVLCGKCAEVCPRHRIKNGIHCIDRTGCTACGKCAEACTFGALRICGQKITVTEAFRRLTADRMFYETSGGGVTLSGGEPLLQPKFCVELLTALKREGVHTAVDTCGCVKWEFIAEMLPVTDIFLFDFKHADSIAHRKLTGQGNELIIDNLRHLSACGAKIEIRIPLIPGCNDSEVNLCATGKILGELRLEWVKILPYHSMARSKYAALDMPDTMQETETPDDTAIAQAVVILREYGVNAVSGKE